MASINSNSNQSKTVDFLGQKIVIPHGDHGKDALDALNFAKTRVSEFQSKHPNLSPHALAVLSLLELSGEIVRDRQAIDDYRKELDSKCQSILKEIDDLEAS